MKRVIELTRNMNHIEEDWEALLFPNVLTCTAIVATDGFKLVGAHLSVFDGKDRVEKAWQKMKERFSTDRLEVLVVGPNIERAKFTGIDTGQVRFEDCESEVDLYFERWANLVLVKRRPTGDEASSFDLITLN